MVRPNQGLILPGQKEVIQIVLIEKDALELVRTYQTLGMAALEQGGNKDKFLIQSTTVSLQDAQTKYTSYDAITTLWSSSSNHQHTHAMANKKLHVRYHIHSVSSNTTTATADTTTTPTMHNRTAVMTAHTNSTPPLLSSNNHNHSLPVTSSSTDPNNNNNNSMTKEQLLMDVQNIRRKYDELIAFSVNLTAERDLISNTLEVTKRDYKQLQLQSQQQRFKSPTHQSAAASTTNRLRFFTHVVGIAMMMVLCSLLSLSFGIYIVQQQQQEEEQDPSIHRIPSVLQPIVQYMVQMISTLLASTTNTNMTHTQLLLNADDTTTTTTTTNDEF